MPPLSRFPHALSPVRLALAVASITTPMLARSHPGHGFDVPHFHTHDAMLVIGLIAVVGIVAAFIGRK